MALVLTRKPEESIIIDGDTRVTVVAINGNQVRIAIDAPKEKSIDREEIFIQKIEAANRGF